MSKWKEFLVGGLPAVLDGSSDNNTVGNTSTPEREVQGVSDTTDRVAQAAQSFGVSPGVLMFVGGILVVGTGILIARAVK